VIRAWPRSLFGRLVLVLLGGLALTQALTLWVNQSERGQLLHRAGGMQLAQRVADIARLLDSTAPAERGRIVALFAAPPLVVSTTRPPIAAAEIDDEAELQLSMFAGMLRYSLGERMELVAVRRSADNPRLPAPGFGSRALPPGIERPGFGAPGAVPGPGPGQGLPMMRHGMPDHMPRRFGPGGPRYLAQVRLGDGTLVTFDSEVSPQDSGLPMRLALTLLALVGTVLVLALVAVRWVTGPLSALAKAAEELGGDIDRPPLPETGPTEVKRAAKAFNTMQQRLQRFLSDRTRVLAAMSHDLKTPITRMRLRTEMLEDETQRAKFAKDLQEMESMVAQALEYMRDTSSREASQDIDAMALLESLQGDFADAGRPFEVRGRALRGYRGRPLALRRCLTNLIDNALRYGTRAVVEIEDDAAQLTLRVLDDGPGLPAEVLEQAFEPFFRGESSRSRETGGTGLGLGIARNIARAHGGDVVLRNREGGGLEAIVTLARTRSP
jgi:signal transduction histidine kinase